MKLGGRRVGVVLGAVCLLGAMAAGAAEVESAIGSNIVGGSGFAPGTFVDVTVVRDGVTLASAAQVQIASDGTFSVNAPGGVCFWPITPALRPGDEVHVTGDGATVVQVQDLAVTRVDHEEGSPIVTLEGRARDAAGQPLQGARVRLWDGAHFVEGAVVDDGAGNVGTEIHLGSPQAAAQAQAMGIAEVVWADPVDPTTVSVGQSPGLPQSAPGCPPVAAAAITEVTPSVIGIDDAPSVTVSGVADPDATVWVTFVDSMGARAGPFEATAGPSGMWSRGDLDVSALESGPLSVSLELQPNGGGALEPSAGTTALLDLALPVLHAVTLNEGRAFTATAQVALATSASDAAPGSGLFVALSSSAASLELAQIHAFDPDMIVTLPGEGLQTVCVRLIDGAGNRAANDACRQVTVDRVPPAFSHRTPVPDTQVVSPLMQASVQVKDSAGVDPLSIVTKVDGVLVPFSLTKDTLTLAHLFAPGPHVVTVALKDTAGNEAQTQWSFNVSTPGAPLTVQLTSPSDGAALPVWKEVALAASAPGASIRRVEFYVGNRLLRSDSSAPYEAKWTPLHPGPYDLTAVAVSASGKRSLHRISVYVCDALMKVCAVPSLPSGGGPMVQLLAPEPNAWVAFGAKLDLVAIAHGPAPIVWVRFLVDGALIGTDTTPRYQAAWTAKKRGLHRVRALTMDTRGRIATHEVTVQVN